MAYEVDDVHWITCLRVQKLLAHVYGHEVFTWACDGLELDPEDLPEDVLEFNLWVSDWRSFALSMVSAWEDRRTQILQALDKRNIKVFPQCTPDGLQYCLDHPDFESWPQAVQIEINEALDEERDLAWNLPDP